MAILRPGGYRTREPLDVTTVPEDENYALETRLPMDEGQARWRTARFVVVLLLCVAPATLVLRVAAYYPLAFVLRVVAVLTGVLLALGAFRFLTGRSAREFCVRVLAAAVGVLAFVALLKIGRTPRAAYMLVFPVALVSADWLADAVKTQFVWWLTADDALDATTRSRLRAEWQTRPVHATPVLIAYFAGLGFTWLGGNGVALFAALYCTFRALRDADAQTPAPLAGRVRVAWRALVVFLNYDRGQFNAPFSFRFPSRFFRPPARRGAAVALVVALLTAAFLGTGGFPGLEAHFGVREWLAGCAVPALLFFAALTD